MPFLSSEGGRSASRWVLWDSESVYKWPSEYPPPGEPQPPGLRFFDSLTVGLSQSPISLETASSVCVSLTFGNTKVLLNNVRKPSASFGHRDLMSVRSCTAPAISSP